MTSRSSPSSPRQWKATRSPRPASTWRSSALWEAFSLPPVNHLKKGASDSSSTVSQGSAQSSASACFAHHAWGSRAASSCSDSSEISALSTNSAGGSKIS